METPRPSEAHKKSGRLIGSWTGEETIHPLPWNPQGGQAEARIESKPALGELAVDQDCQQRRAGPLGFECDTRTPGTRNPEGHCRAIFDFTGRSTNAFRMKVSVDGDKWRTFMGGRHRREP